MNNWRMRMMIVIIWRDNNYNEDKDEKDKKEEIIKDDK